MSNEASKALKRLESDYLWRRVRELDKPWLDIGGGGDGLPGARLYDLPDDAQTCANLDNGSFNLVWSSHCLEHMEDAPAALWRWWELVRPGGYLWLIVPDFELYEHKQWPSRFNPDHKWKCHMVGFTDPATHDIAILHDVLSLPGASVLRIQRVDTGYDYSLPDNVDQSGGETEVAIEAVLRKHI